MEKSRLTKLIKLTWEGVKFSFTGFNWKEGIKETDIMKAAHKVHPELGYDFERLLRLTNKEKNTRPRYAPRINNGGGYATPIFDKINMRDIK